MRPPTEEDLRVLARQLGRSPRGALAVKPCLYGFPQVILNAPFLRPAASTSLSGSHVWDQKIREFSLPAGTLGPQGPSSFPGAFPSPPKGKRVRVRAQETLEPMPTIFWLTCPFLVEEVSKLESAGGVKGYERLLEANEELAQNYLAAHQAYREMRLSLLSREELEYAKAKGIHSILESGIAGIMNPKRVKCLHAQLAHFLATGQNPIGALVAQELPALACPDQRCALFITGA